MVHLFSVIVILCSFHYVALIFFVLCFNSCVVWLLCIIFVFLIFFHFWLVLMLYYLS